MTVNDLASEVASCFRVSFPIRSGPFAFFDLRELSISVTFFAASYFVECIWPEVNVCSVCF